MKTKNTTSLELSQNQTIIKTKSKLIPLNTHICKTQILVQLLIDVQSSNICPISMSQTFVPHIYVIFILKISNQRPILKSMSFFKFSVRRLSNLWSFLTFSNRCPMTSLTYALTDERTQI